MFSIYYIASESNQVCLWLPYILNTTKSPCSLNENTMNGFPFCCGRRGSGLDDVMTSARTSGSDVYRYYFCTNCTNTQCLLPAPKGEGRFASWVILIGGAKTDEPITGNITGSFCIFLLANPAWPSYRGIARSISNNMKNLHTKLFKTYHRHNLLVLYINSMQPVLVTQYIWCSWFSSIYIVISLTKKSSAIGLSQRDHAAVWWLKGNVLHCSS